MMQKTPPGWVSEEKFLEHLKLFAMPCIDFLIEIPGKGIVWAERVIDPMKGQKVIFGARVLRTDKSFEQASRRIAFEETGLQINSDELIFVGQQIVEFDEKIDGVGRLDVVTCWAIKISDSNLVKLNTKHYSEKFEISYEIPQNAGEMYHNDAEKYLQLKT